MIIKRTREALDTDQLYAAANAHDGRIADQVWGMRLIRTKGPRRAVVERQ